MTRGRPFPQMACSVVFFMSSVERWDVKSGSGGPGQRVSNRGDAVTSRPANAPAPARVSAAWAWLQRFHHITDYHRSKPGVGANKLTFFSIITSLVFGDGRR